MNKLKINLSLSIFLMLLFIFPSNLMGEPLLFSKSEVIKSAKEEFKKGHYSVVINKLEGLALSGNLDNNSKAILYNAYEAAVRNTYKKKDYKLAISLVKKMVLLRPKDSKWLGILHNLYFRAKMYTNGIKFGESLLKNREDLKLSKKDIAKIHGRNSMFYAAIGEKEKFEKELKLSLSLLTPKKEIKKYIKYIVPSLMKKEEFITIIKNSLQFSEDNKKFIISLIPLHNPKKNRSVAKKETTKNKKKEFISKKIIINNSIRNEKKKIKSENKNSKKTTEFKPKKEIYKLFLQEGDKLFKEGKYDKAMIAYNKAREVAPPDLLKTIDRKKFSVYFRKNKKNIEYGGFGLILSLLLLLLYFTGFFRRKNDDYGLVSPAKTMAKGMKFIEKEKWDSALLELSKIPEASLKREDSIKLSLNLALAYMAKNNNSNAILHARRAIKKDPGNVDANLILGKVYQKLGDHTLRAMQVYEFLADRNLANIRMLKSLAAYFVKSNNISEKSYKVAIDIQRYEPDDLVSSQIIVRWYHHNNRIDDESLAFMKRISEQIPKDVNIKIYLLEIYFRRKDYKSVIREAMYIFPLTVDNVIVHSLFIDSIVRLKQFKMLITEYERLSIENPRSIVVKYIYQSMHSLLIKKREYPETDIALSLKVNFTVCPKCFHLNLTEYNNCQKCKAQLNP